ncbi:MAG: hypothetical protein ACFFCS_23085 [Candidatus Hodarchaeota archaeon]
MVDCDKCAKNPPGYLITIKDGNDEVKKRLCFRCYKESQTLNIVNVQILK